MRRFRTSVIAIGLAAAGLLGACGPRVPTRPRLHPRLEYYIQRRATRPATSRAEPRDAEEDLSLAHADRAEGTLEPEPTR